MKDQQESKNDGSIAAASSREDKIKNFQDENLEATEEYVILKHDAQHLEQLSTANKQLLTNLSALYEKVSTTSDFDELQQILLSNKALLKTIFAQDNTTSKANSSLTQLDWEQLFGCSRQELESLLLSER
ncbi:hypothetical protein ACO0QE_000834 [Hanseniaspora vineae]